MVLAFLSKRKISLLNLVLALLFFVPCAMAQYKNERYASLQRSKDAIGHYARARSMLVRALQEFEEGRKLARPDLLLDAEEWRLSVISRAEELNRVLDPQPKVVRSGTRFSASPLRVERQKQQLPPLEIGPAGSNTQGEDEILRQKEIEAVKARMSEVSKEYQAPADGVQEPGYVEPVLGSSKSSTEDDFALIEEGSLGGAVPSAPVAAEASPVVDALPEQDQQTESNGLSVGDILPSKVELKEVEEEGSDAASKEESEASNIAKGPAAEAPVLFKAQEAEPVVEQDQSASKEDLQKPGEAENYDDDAAVSAAIERSLKERLGKLNGGAQ